MIWVALEILNFLFSNKSLTNPVCKLIKVSKYNWIENNFVGNEAFM